MAADKTSVNITYFDSNGKKGMKAITDINPNASNSAIRTFATGLNALTTNTIASLEKIERTNITAEQINALKASAATAIIGDKADAAFTGWKDARIVESEVVYLDLTTD